MPPGIGRSRKANGLNGSSTKSRLLTAQLYFSACRLPRMQCFASAEGAAAVSKVRCHAGQDGMKRLLWMQDVPFPGKQRAFGPAFLCGMRGVRYSPEKPTASAGADRSGVPRVSVTSAVPVLRVSAKNRFTKRRKYAKLIKEIRLAAALGAGQHKTEACLSHIGGVFYETF